LKKKKSILPILVLFTFFFVHYSHAQINVPGGETCSDSQPFCSDNTGQYVFSNVTNVSGIGQIGCMNSSENPAWFFIRVEQTGSLEFQIEQNTSSNFNGGGLDVDFIAWGPFTTPDSNCNNLDEDCITGSCPDNTDDPNYYLNNLDGSNIVDCSWSALSEESFTIPNAVQGEFYILLISNFVNQPGFIRLTQTNFGNSGAGSTDCSIIAGDLGPDQDVCEGDTVILDGTPTSGTATGYEWFLDEGAGFNLLVGENDPTLTIDDDRSGTYRVEVTDGDGNTAQDDVVITFNPPPTVNNPVALQLCSLNENGFANFNLTDANPLISSNAANETFQYYPSETDAIQDTNEITNTTNYTNQIENSDAVWVRTISEFDCFSISRIDLEVATVIIPSNFQQTFEVCDDDDGTAGSDMDGITTFDFSNVTADIIALFPSDQTLDISYYESQTDANVPQNPIADISNYRNENSPNSQQIFIRVENTANNTCIYVGTHVTLNVLPVPPIATPPDMDLCDNDSDGDDTSGFIRDIDLESQTPIILNGLSPADYTITYHESQGDATAGANPLASPYSNSVMNGQTIYVRALDNASGCFTDLISFEVNIRPLPMINDVVELRQCDDDTDGRSPFNLNEANELISPTNFVNETFEFFETLADAQNDVNAILNPTMYVNDVPTNDRVWARAISTFGCFRIAEVNLEVTASSAVVQNYPPQTYNACDDFLDEDGNDTAANSDTDGITNFDFSDFTAPLIQAFPFNERPNLTVDYYRNLTDALAEQDPIDPADYRNINYPNTQQIYVRVENSTNNECQGISPLITLVVDPVPVANPVSDLELCDNSDDGNFTNGIVQTFDLTSQTPGILGSQDPSTYTVTYYETAADANAGTNAIPNPDAYTNIVPNQQTIYIRVTHNTQGCFVDRSTFDLIVHPLPVANFVPDLQVCDDGTGGSGQNGFSSNIDLELQTAGILGTQDPNQFTVTYHESLAQAQAGTDALTSPFANTEAFVQTIYVRIVNNTTLCANDISNFNVIINPEPTTEDVEDLTICDDDQDGDDRNGFVQNINLDSQIPLILGPSQDEDDFTVTFHETQADADLGINALSSPYSNTIANQQTIYVRVVKDDTGCANTRSTFDVIINPLPEFEVTSPQIVCLNGPDLILSIENPSAIYDYVWTDPEGNMIVGSQITVTSGGLYLVTATTTNGTNCSRTLEIQVNESIIATLTEASITITDDSDNNTLAIDPTTLGIGDYEYALEDENGIVVFPFQDDPLFQNLEGGFYTVVVRDKNGCGEVSLDVSVVEFPKFFTPNNDGVNDTWNIKGANSTFFPTSEIHIFNRFGKLIAQINIDNPGWNGTFNGKVMPSDDYWFSIRLVDRNGNVRTRQGNLSLLRR
jgi:gliding motility-associated-like protein